MKPRSDSKIARVDASKIVTTSARQKNSYDENIRLQRSYVKKKYVVMPFDLAPFERRDILTVAKEQEYAVMAVNLLIITVSSKDLLLREEILDCMFNYYYFILALPSPYIARFRSCLNLNLFEPNILVICPVDSDLVSQPNLLAICTVNVSV